MERPRAWIGAAAALMLFLLLATAPHAGGAYAAMPLPNQAHTLLDPLPPPPAPVPPENMTVHLIFSSHLDVGFTDMDSAVIELHWYTHWPRAVSRGGGLDGPRERGPRDDKWDDDKSGKGEFVRVGRGAGGRHNQSTTPTTQLPPFPTPSPITTPPTKHTDPARALV
jgi:hypothetical protein